MQNRKKARKNQQSTNAHANLIQNPSPLLGSSLPVEGECVQTFIDKLGNLKNSPKDVIDHLDKAITMGYSDRNITVVQLREAMAVVK